MQHFPKISFLINAEYAIRGSIPKMISTMYALHPLITVYVVLIISLFICVVTDCMQYNRSIPWNTTERADWLARDVLLLWWVGIYRYAFYTYLFIFIIVQITAIMLSYRVKKGVYCKWIFQNHKLLLSRLAVCNTDSWPLLIG